MTGAGFRAGALALVLLTTPCAGQRPTRRVYRAAEIAAAGWHRVGEIVEAVAPGRTASLDGFNASLTAGRLPFAGVSAPAAPQWVVRVDGMRLPSTIDGMWILDALPIAMTQIDSIAVDEGVAIVDGRPSPLGTIDIYSRKIGSGPAVIGDYEFGDESGDPGPYRYTPRATPNVEKLGPSASGAAGIGGPGWSLDAAARYASLNVTDTNIARLLGAQAPAVQSDVNASGGSATLRTSLLNGAQSTIGGRGRFTGILWVPSRSRFEAVHAVATHFGSTGSMPVGSLHVRYGVTGTALETAPMNVPIPSSVTFTRFYSDLFAELGGGSMPVTVGAGVARSHAGGGSAPFASVDSGAVRLWAGLAPSAKHSAVVSVMRTPTETAVNASGSITLDAIAGVGTTLRAASVQQLAADDGQWIDEATQENPGASPPSPPYRSPRISEAAIVFERPVGAWLPSADLRIVRADRWRIETVSGPADGTLGYGMLGASIRSAPLSRVSGSVRAEGSIWKSGSAAMIDAMRSTPAASISADVSTVVLGDLRLAAAGRASTSTWWPDTQTSPAADEPGLRRIDLSANKMFWKGRARAQLVIRNILATEERYHPAGAEWNFRTHLAVTLALPPWSDGR